MFNLLLQFGEKKNDYQELTDTLWNWYDKNSKDAAGCRSARFFKSGRQLKEFLGGGYWMAKA